MNICGAAAELQDRPWTIHHAAQPKHDAEYIPLTIELRIWPACPASGQQKPVLESGPASMLLGEAAAFLLLDCWIGSASENTDIFVNSLSSACVSW